MINNEKLWLNLTVTACPRLEKCIIKSKNPEKIKIDDLCALTHFSLDLINEWCFLELERFEEKVFEFGNQAPHLRLFLLRTGNDSEHQIACRPIINDGLLV